MKNLLFTIVSTALLIISKATLLAAEDKVIVIKPGSLTETTTPNRSPELVPIEAYYDDFTSSVYVSFCTNIGNVDLIIVNQDTSEFIEETINAYGTMIAVPISGNPGLYYLSFTLQSGIEYYGEFEITL